VKILISSYVFSPSVGGIETVSALLAPEFVKAGHDVILVTSTGSEDQVSWPFEIVRRPGPARLLELVRWCDVYFQNNISLLLAWPLLFIRRPWIVAHHTWLGNYGQRPGFKSRLKRALLNYAANTAISNAVASDLSAPSTVVGNPYSTLSFNIIPGITRDREFVYLGRLVSDKGVDLLIDAMSELQKSGCRPRLTIIGSGPEEMALRRQVESLQLQDQVDFAGSSSPEVTCRLLNAHQILVAPSRWVEPFGLVALEGIACGCVVVASNAGGLPEAVGPCGLLFPSGNRSALTESLRALLTQPELRQKLRANAAAHLRQFEPATVAAKYLAVFEQALNPRRSPQP
jgi:glycosyltransferase involved in cell wall biosynthesis